jgi:hypothetical protein
MIKAGHVILVGCLLTSPLSEATSTNVIEVMTFNLRYASASDGDNNWHNDNQSPQRREVVTSVIANRAPDVVGFQEGEDVQLDYLEASLPPWYGILRQRPSGGSGAENAAIAYNTNRLDLLDRGVFSLGPRPGGGYWNNAPGTNFDPYVYFPDMGLPFPRLALWSRFRWRPTGQEFLFYTTHFDFNDEPQVRGAFLMTDDAIARNARRPASPLSIVVGDFNSSQNNRDWKLFTGSFSTNGLGGDFTDSWLQVHGAWTGSGTFHGFNGGVISGDSRIDWVLHRGGFTATNALIVTDAAVATNLATHATRLQYPSDHYPVLASLQLPPPGPDFDRDQLPDSAELSSPISRPADADSDGDLLLDGQEDLDADGQVEGGETHPGIATSTQTPTDIRNYQMDGIRDHGSALLASHGLDLHWRFDGRYLYARTQDAGEGSDHFIFVTRNPEVPTNAPWAKAGQVASWTAFLADENDGGFCGWFDASRTLITNLFVARVATYFENGGSLEGVIDLSAFYGAGFTDSFFLAAAPFGTADGGTNYAPAQVPAGNGDGNILGTGEFIRIDPGDQDHDGISDFADPDRDGDGLPDLWEDVYGIDSGNAQGAEGSDGDPDGDGAGNRDECLAGTFPDDGSSVFKMLAAEATGSLLRVSWPALHGRTNVIERGAGLGAWSGIFTNANTSTFPLATNSTLIPLLSTAGVVRAGVSP